MLAHNIKDVLTLVPEAFTLVKGASLDKDFPVDNASSVAASFLVATYLEKVAHKSISTEVFSLIKKAVDLYGLKDELTPLVLKFDLQEKQASASPEETLAFEQTKFEGGLSGLGYFSLEKTASAAEALMDKFGDLVDSEHVKQYACAGWLNKAAAVQSLANRFTATGGKETGYLKIARLVLDSVPANDTTAIQDVCRTVTGLDKKAGLDILGFNFYKEAILTKSAAIASSLTVNVGGEGFSYEKVVKFGKDRIGMLLGADIGKSLTGDPVNDKAIIESLPRDLQLVLRSGLKNV